MLQVSPYAISKSRKLDKHERITTNISRMVSSNFGFRLGGSEFGSGNPRFRGRVTGQAGLELWEVGGLLALGKA